MKKARLTEAQLQRAEEAKLLRDHSISPALERRLQSLKGRSAEELAQFICINLPRQKNIALEADLLGKVFRTVKDVTLFCLAIEAALKINKHPRTKARLLLSHYLLNSSDEKRRREIEKVEKELLKLSQAQNYNMIGILYYVLDINISWKNYAGIQRALSLLVRTYNIHGSPDHPIQISYLAFFDTRQISARVLQGYLNACQKFYRETKETY